MLCKDKLLWSERMRRNRAITVQFGDCRLFCQFRCQTHSRVLRGEWRKHRLCKSLCWESGKHNVNGPDCLFQEHRTATFEGDILKLSGGCTHLQQSIRGWITALIQDHLRNQWSSWWWAGELGQVSASCSWFPFMWIWVYCHCNPCQGRTKCYLIVEYHILKTCCQ